MRGQKKVRNTVVTQIPGRMCMSNQIKCYFDLIFYQKKNILVNPDILTEINSALLGRENSRNSEGVFK